MRRFLLGLIVGGVLAMGFAAHGLPDPGEDWSRTPMRAETGSYLAENGHCKRDQRLMQWGGWQSRKYRCVPKGYP